MANAAAELHGDCDRVEDRFDGLRIDRLAGKCPVEIDNVQIFETLPLEGQRLFGGIVIEDRRLCHVALEETNAASLF